MCAINNKYKISAHAEEDLINIFLESIDTWGIEKARQYSQSIEDTFNQLAEYPGLGKARDELYVGALSFPVGSHLIFYRQTVGNIEIARVLHQRMDYQRHLPSKKS